MIVGVKCLRRALGTLADLEDAARGCLAPTDGAEIRALRVELDLVQDSLREIRATLGTDQPGREDRLLQ